MRLLSLNPLVQIDYRKKKKTMKDDAYHLKLFGSSLLETILAILTSGAASALLT
jgi:hypothetical protein